jgi:hypothetical protein
VILPLYFYIKKRKRRRFCCASSHRHTPIFFKYNFNEKLNHLLITNRTSFFPKPIHLWRHWFCHATGIFCGRRFPPRNVISPAGIWTILKFRDQLLREISIIKLIKKLKSSTKRTSYLEKIEAFRLQGEATHEVSLDVPLVEPSGAADDVSSTSSV